MKSKEPTATNWNLVQAFLALNRYGGYELASERENLDDSTLRRRISQLEAHFGRQLFVNSDGVWTIAPDLGSLVVSAEKMYQAANAFFNEQPTCSGDVTISIADAFGLRLEHVFSALQEKYPLISLNIITETRFANLSKDKVDIAIRLARPIHNSNSLRIRKLGDVPMNAYASPAYLEKRGQVSDQDDRSLHHLLIMKLQFPHNDHSFPYAAIDWEDLGLHGKTHTYVDSLTLLQKMCEMGRGVALLPVSFAHDNPQLKLVQKDYSNVNTELWLVSRLDLRAKWQLDLAEMLQQEISTWNT
ncbi:LysR family transcriptional regulator [Pseudomonas sp. AP-1]|uniref:LysR family transcriptional regulator n=1 Tax=Pseudomonas sp. AP-1 TaxID=3231718 RepID=UPI0010288143|nr:LysR family transcriptional regulator [Pseudomonas moorei]